MAYCSVLFELICGQVWAAKKCSLVKIKCGGMQLYVAFLNKLIDSRLVLELSLTWRKSKDFKITEQKCCVTVSQRQIQ